MTTISLLSAISQRTATRRAEGATVRVTWDPSARPCQHTLGFHWPAVIQWAAGIPEWDPGQYLCHLLVARNANSRSPPRLEWGLADCFPLCSGGEDKRRK